MHEGLQLLVEQLRGLDAVAAVAVYVDRAGGGGVVDEEDGGDHVLGAEAAGDGVVRDEVLHRLLALRQSHVRSGRRGARPVSDV